jgi:hypothetical protein
VSSIRRHLSYANVISTLCLFLILGGGAAIAASQLAKNSVGAKQLRSNAVTGAKVKDGSLTGSDVNASTLGQVPSAKVADTATTAQKATEATRATNATHADNADQAAHAQRASTADVASSLPPPELPHPVGATGEPAFGTGWSNRGTNRPASFYIDREGIVHLQGEVQHTNGSPVTIFVLPPAYRPGSDNGRLFEVTTFGPAIAAGTIAVESTGEVNFIGTNTNPEVFLDGASWRAGS